MKDNIPLADYTVDQTTNPTAPSLSKAVHGGILELDDDDKPLRYKIRLTEHLNNVIRNDADNVKLGLVVTSDIRIINNGEIETGTTDDDFVPAASITNPFGTVLHGSTTASPEDKRLKLEIFYTISETN